MNNEIWVGAKDSGAYIMLSVLWSGTFYMYTVCWLVISDTVAMSVPGTGVLT